MNYSIWSGQFQRPPKEQAQWLIVAAGSIPGAQEGESLLRPGISLWNVTTGIEEHPKDSKGTTRHSDKALMGSMHQAKIPFTSSEEGADLRTDSDPRTASGTHLAMVREMTTPTLISRSLGFPGEKRESALMGENR